MLLVELSRSSCPCSARLAGDKQESNELPATESVVGGKTRLNQAWTIQCNKRAGCRQKYVDTSDAH